MLSVLLKQQVRFKRIILSLQEALPTLRLKKYNRIQFGGDNNPESLMAKGIRVIYHPILRRALQEHFEKEPIDSICPKRFKSLRGHLRVANRMMNIFMSQVVLNCPGIMSLIC